MARKLIISLTLSFKSAWNSCVPYGNTQDDRRNAHNKIWVDLAAATSDCMERSIRNLRASLLDTIAGFHADAYNKLEQYDLESKATQDCDDSYAKYTRAHPSHSEYFHSDPYRPFRTLDKEMERQSSAGDGSRMYKQGMYN